MSDPQPLSSGQPPRQPAPPTSRSGQDWPTVALPPRAQVNPTAVEEWWHGPALGYVGSDLAGNADPSDPNVSVAEFLGLNDAEFLADMLDEYDESLPKQLQELVCGASAAGLFGLPHHAIGLVSLGYDTDGVHEGYLVIVQPPTGNELRLASHPLPVDALLDCNLAAAGWAANVLHNVALEVNQQLTAFEITISAWAAAPTVGATRESGMPNPAALANAFDPNASHAAQPVPPAVRRNAVVVAPSAALLDKAAELRGRSAALGRPPGSGHHHH